MKRKITRAKLTRQLKALPDPVLIALHNGLKPPQNSHTELSKLTSDLDATVVQIQTVSEALFGLTNVCGVLSHGAPSDVPYQVAVIIADELDRHVAALRVQRDALHRATHGGDA